MEEIQEILEHYSLSSGYIYKKAGAGNVFVLFFQLESEVSGNLALQLPLFSPKKFSIALCCFIAVISPTRQIAMNFLAHLYLSGDTEQLMLGNFIADFAKGGTEEFYQDDVYLGILLHREIDTFTDRHPRVAKSRQRLWPRHRHYSSVIVDIFYDHFLARNWQQYSDIPLEDFVSHAYATILRFDELLPQRAKQVLPHMIANNWLVNYAKLEGINRAMQGMARRAAFKSEMAGAIRDLQKDYEQFANDFRIFFPELADHAKSFLQGSLRQIDFLQKTRKPGSTGMNS